MRADKPQPAPGEESGGEGEKGEVRDLKTEMNFVETATSSILKGGHVEEELASFCMFPKGKIESQCKTS